MCASVRFAGEVTKLFPGLLGRLHAGSLPREADDGVASGLLVAMAEDADSAIAAASIFAAPPGVGGDQRLVVAIWRAPARDDWPALRQEAVISAFVRHAALDWAGRRVRANGISLQAPLADVPGLEADVAATVLAMWRWPSMTGQIIQLAQPQ